jgi:4-hydroxy-4-methyl-2-oxoglutarate aldolase
VDLGGITVRSGDVVVGTADGVVALAQESVEQVLRAAEARRDRELEMFRQLGSGKTTIEILGLPSFTSRSVTCK